MIDDVFTHEDTFKPRSVNSSTGATWDNRSHTLAHHQPTTNSSSINKDNNGHFHARKSDISDIDDSLSDSPKMSLSEVDKEKLSEHYSEKMSIKSKEIMYKY
eukprot:CAMPEP_0116902712 /NCGR_PEP_ID=MMETSP0467-20121206/10218_1 /TAXON_ID=283647 /ORGANISM="Mesodinium pulex, Strain SPMC105" /LENGTH=101 /DNA_ID=CAMNT_0004576681 /DNA_START=256 /DNA_END=561 /DNA_ORIENTATION=-